jgi:glyoxylase-like metal-dependent hydrolase (beta-lactamase superfamily II)
MAELTFDRNFVARPGVVENLSPGIRRVLCGNAGPYTFKGTSTFIVGRGTVAVIDPGPADERHLEALLAALANETVSHILVTHSHADHSPLAAALKLATGATTVAYGGIAAAEAEGPRLDASVDSDFLPDIALPDGESVTGPGWTLTGIFTPGHMSNHMCFALREEETLFAGDHVMAWATSVVAPPDGNMADYMASLRRLLEREDRLYHPAHGPSRPDPKPLLRGYVAHRRMREAAILNRLKLGDRRIAEIVAVIYADVDPRLHGAAALSTEAHLRHLIDQGLVRAREGPFEPV